MAREESEDEPHIGINPTRLDANFGRLDVRLRTWKNCLGGMESAPKDVTCHLFEANSSCFSTCD